MAIRVIAALGRGHTGPPGPGRPAARTGRLVPWGASIAVAAVILLATVPALITQTEVSDPQARGLLPANLIFYAGLYRALPQLLNWLFLALAIAVLLTLPLAPCAQDGTVPYRSAVRRLAIPVLALILFSSYAHLPWLFSDYTWLYIPVTPIVGVVLITRLVLPAQLAKKHRTLAPADAIHRADLLPGGLRVPAGDQRDPVRPDGPEIGPHAPLGLDPGAQLALPGDVVVGGGRGDRDRYRHVPVHDRHGPRASDRHRIHRAERTVQRDRRKQLWRKPARVTAVSQAQPGRRSRSATTMTADPTIRATLLGTTSAGFLAAAP
jgi:hypothetical protein